MLGHEAAQHEILAAIEAVSAGLTALAPEQMDLLLPSAADNDESEPWLHEALTARESEVLAMLAEGTSNKEIAARLKISEHTAKFHVSSILAKLGATTRTEAVSRGVRQGLIVIDAQLHQELQVAEPPLTMRAFVLGVPAAGEVQRYVQQEPDQVDEWKMMAISRLGRTDEIAAIDKPLHRLMKPERNYNCDQVRRVDVDHVVEAAELARKQSTRERWYSVLIESHQMLRGPECQAPKSSARIATMAGIFPR